MHIRSSKQYQEIQQSRAQANERKNERKMQYQDLIHLKINKKSLPLRPLVSH